MKLKFYLLLILNLSFCGSIFSQIEKIETKADTSHFNYSYWNGVADKEHLNEEERSAFILKQKQLYIDEQTHTLSSDSDYVWSPAETHKGSGPASTNTYGQPCINIDFENGLSSWTLTNGWNPATGNGTCCPTSGADVTVMTNTTATDPIGGFPVVYPLAGSVSVKLGSTTAGGKADRIAQTFFVTANTSNFTYRYAAVLNAGNHNPGEQAYFLARILDTLGNAISCTTYSAEAGTGTYTNVIVGGNSYYYRAWTDVAIDLTAQIGRNVTMEFTVYDCWQTAHFAYVYLDGLCTKFDFLTRDTICPNVPKTICAPQGFSVTTWNGPGVINNLNRCITAATAGTYFCTTILPTGCTGPTFTHVVTALPNPVMSFTPSFAPCSPVFTFNSTQSISSGSITSRLWTFGDGGTSTVANPTYTYAVPGFYNVRLKLTSNRGCSDSNSVAISVFPKPNLAFSPPSNCINTVVQFTNTSTILPGGSITGYTWTLGNGATSNLVNPVNTYTASGVYTITLTGISNNGCIATLTQTFGIFPPPVISFSVSPLCDVNGTAFSPSTSTAIASGSLATYFWSFGDGGTSTQANPVHVYATPGIYTVNFSAVSNHNCSATTSGVFSISPSPVVAFATTSVNACTHNFTFTNNSTIGAGSVSYTWNIGGVLTTTVVNPGAFIFPADGSYTVTLIGRSNLGCLDTAIQYVTVYPYPVVNFSVPASCENAIFTVSTTAVSGSVTSYNWDFGDPASGAANTSTLQNPTHFYSTTNSYTITLNLLSNLNCPSTTVAPITVFPNPVAGFVSSNLNNCSLPYTFTNTSTTSNIGGSTLSKFFWNFGAAGSSTLQNPGTINFPSNGTYSVNLIAITNHNCSDTTSTTILVHPLPSLDFTLTPSCINVPAVMPSTATISPIPSSTSSILSYTWNLGDNTYTSTATTPPHTYSASGNYTVTYSATSDKGCITSVSKTQTIHPIAVLDFTTTSNMCLGYTTTFSSSASVSSGSIFAQNWSFGDGTTGYNPNPTHTYSTSGSYPVSFSVSTNNECNAYLTKTVTIHPLPVVNFTTNGGCLNTISNFTESCTITNTLSNAITGYTYTFGDGSSVTAQSPAHTYSTHGTYIPTLTVGTNQGCLKSNTISVVINPLPNIIFGPPGGCENSVIQFTNSSNIPLGIISSYTWNFANGSSSNSLNPVSTYSIFGPYTVSLSATSNLGCVKTGTNTLTIYPYPQLTVTPNANSCINDTALINTNQSIAAGAIQSYTLTYGDGGLNTFTSIPATYQTKHKYIAYNTYTVTLSAISNNGCAYTTSNTINVYPKPFVNYTSANYCYGDLTVFTSSCNIPPPYTITDYIWNFNDGSATPISTLQNPSHVFLTTNTLTTFSVSLTAKSYPEGISAPLTCFSVTTKTISIFPIPVASFSTNNACLGKPTNFINSTPLSSPASPSIAGYDWYFYNNGQINSNFINPSYTYSSAGIYTVQLVARNNYNCANDTIQTVTVYNNPVASFTASDVCLGNNTIFNNTTPPPIDGMDSTSLWTRATTTLGTTRDLTYQFNTAGTYSVTLTSMSTLGCINKYTNTVTVFPLPTVVILSKDVCQRSSIQFTNASSISTGSISTYNWNFGDPLSGPSNTSTALSPSHKYNLNGVYTVTLEAISDKNCSDTAMKNVIVHKLPSALFNHTIVCAGDNLNFSNTSTANDGTITSNLWDFNGDNVFDIDAPQPNYLYTAPGNYNVKLVVTTNFGCADTMARSLDAHPKAKGDFTSDNKTGCPPVCINFTNTSYISSGSFITTWDFGDGSPNNTIENPSHCYNAGVYDVGITVVSNVGCITKFKQPGYISIFPVPTANFKVVPEEVDEDDPLIEVTGQMGPDVDQVKYYINDGTTFNTRDFNHYIKNLKSTKPMVVLVAKNKYGCADTVSKVLEIKPSYAIYFPNVFTPNGDGNNDVFMPKGVGIAKFSIQIYDRWGHNVFKSNDMADMWDGRVKDNDGAIKEDVYTWRAQVTDIFTKTHYFVGHVTIIK